MIGIKIRKGIVHHEFAIHHCKLILGTNYKNKFEFRQTLYQFMMNISQSEYEYENNMELEFYINHSLMQNKQFKIIKIGDSFELQEELKLTSKSPLLGYCDHLLSNQLNYDTIQTINYLFQSLSEILEEQSNLFHFQFPEINQKQLLKLLTIELFQENYKSNIMNLSYEEYYLLQLETLVMMDKSNPTIFIICIIQIDVLTEAIYHKLNEFKEIKFILFVNHYECHIDISDIYYIGYGNNIDFADENQLYDLFSYREQNMEGIKNMINNYFNNKGTSVDVDFIDSIIK